ncbi:Lysophospholipase L1 [Pseudobutyrivibrio sp. YE44]|uniref:SGNH/GDSL hydrolase family protein n=1 Tax=Pseudobutyrivibrio sp. YE44 TaxID=1520802 RepID=UPI00088CC41F|nr:SGNH/GDSL hydrolase family protein [Pseudobutyrivibrio sp. YE44]SDB31340.1 Lysophospholipase L1 [Pseudobutyrivibrio sp. YE44]
MKKKIVIGLWISLFILIICFCVMVVSQRKQQQAEQEAALARLEQEEQEKATEEETPSEKETDSTENVKPDSYTFTDFEATYYSQSKVNVREEPNDTAEILGTFSLDQRVSIVAKCNETDYYKVKTNGDYGYVAFDDLSEEYIPIPLPTAGKSVPSATKDILFIGNSITLYPATKDWWGSGWGCGATAPENDYVHLTVAAKGYGSYDYMSLRSWEFSSTRNYELDDLDPYITKYQYGTIVIELGENVKNHEDHFKEDLSDMIKYIKTYNPNARIVMLDNFWPYKSIIATKKAVASENGVTYVSLSDIQGVQDYMLKEGDQFTAPDGTVYTIGSFLAGHPNDAGFAAIAQHLISAL